MKFLKLITIVFLFVFISSCEKSGTASPSITNNTQIYDKITDLDYNSTKCFNSLVSELNGVCKYIKVKAEPDNPSNTRFLDIYYSIVPAINQSNKKEPIVFLIGGPGPSSAHHIATVLGEDTAHRELLKTHDYIFIDYRGAGFSRPYPFCRTDKSNFILSLNKCIENLPKEVHTSDYTSHNIAYDINEVLKKENILKANLFGVSYGTRVASTMLRDFPDRINKVVLDGLFAIEANGISQAKEAILDKLDFLRNKYNKTYPSEDFEARLMKYLKQDTSQLQTLEAVSLLAYVDGSEKTMQYIFDNPVAKFTSRQIDIKYEHMRVSVVFSFAIILYEEFAFVGSQASHSFGFSYELLEILDGFNGGAPVPVEEIAKIKMDIKQPQSIEMKPLITDVPILILSAGLDLQTTLFWAKNAQKNFSNAKHFFFKKQHHGFSMDDSEAIDIASSFFNTDNLNSLNAKKSENFEMID